MSGPARNLGPARYFRAAAIDIDGTLTETDEVHPDLVHTLRECCAGGISVVLATGRTVGDLRARFPQLVELANAVVAENGACLMSEQSVLPLAAPLDPALGERLSAKGVGWSKGEVLLACSGEDEQSVLEAIRELGLEYELVRNRAALMVLPAGVTKGSGVVAALASLGLSPKSAIGIGDAENDHSLLDTCEFGVAVSNAIESLKARADLVLDRPDGSGVAWLLQGLLRGGERLRSRRRNVQLGRTEDGTPVTLPASQLNIIVAGESGDGKSYVAGLIAEQLIGLGYSLVVFDPEGDHVGLSQLPGVSVLDATAVPGAAGVLPLLVRPGTSAVVDLSGLDGPAMRTQLAALSAEVEATRAASGLPHWVLIDEAHRGLRSDGAACAVFDPADKGYVLVTWQPGRLPAEAIAGADAIIALGGANVSSDLVDLVAGASGVARLTVARLFEGGAETGLCLDRTPPGRLVRFRLGERRTAHLRHEHKYGAIGMDSARRFHFRTTPDTPTGRTAGNLTEFEAVLASAGPGVLRHHCPTQDFSRWIRDVLKDRYLAAQIAAIERVVGPASPDALAESARVGMIAALHVRSHAHGARLAR